MYFILTITFGIFLLQTVDCIQHKPHFTLSSSSLSGPKMTHLSGHDYRYPLEEDIDHEIISKIYHNFKRKELLEFLSRDDYSVIEKIKLLEHYRYLIDTEEIINVMIVGDLLDDWNFDIE